MPKTKSKNTFDLTAISDESSYLFYYDRMIELSIAMFEWKNLPETCDESFLERTLFINGTACFFDDNVIGLLSLPYSQNGGFDVYGYPTAIRAYSNYNNYQAFLKNGEYVICYNNMLKTNQDEGARYYARRLWLLDRIIDINANAQKTPILLKGSEKDRLTLQNLYMQYTGNAPVIYAGKNLDLDGMTVLNTQAPFLADKLYELKSNIWNEALTYLGITNVNINKKERLITDEVERGQGGTIAARYSRLIARRKAAEKINKMFGTNITVDFREDTTPETDNDNETKDDLIIETGAD